MDDIRFDRLAAALATVPSRRRLLGTLLGTALVGLLGGPESAAAKKKKKKKKKRCFAGNPIRCGNFCCRPDETCKKGKCVDHCEDGIHNFGETNIDCGGTCRDKKKCDRVRSCVLNADCLSDICFDFAPDRRICGDCRIDSDCDNTNLGSRCIDNLCRDCAANFDCPAERPFCITDSNRCGDFGAACICGECRPGTDTDCPPGQLCREEFVCPSGQLCRHRGDCEGFECDRNSDCPAGEECDQGVCISPSCTTNADCPSGIACVNGACSGTCLPVDAACTDSDDDTCNECCSGVFCCPNAPATCKCCDFGETFGNNCGGRCV